MSWQFSRIRWRLAAAIVLTALIPLCGALLFARDLIRQSTSRFSAPEVAERLDAALGLYRELASEVKERMRQSASSIAMDPALSFALAHDTTKTAPDRGLGNVFRGHRDLARVTVHGDNEVLLLTWNRGTPVAPEAEHEFVVERELPPPQLADATGQEARSEQALTLEAIFATPRARFDGLEDMSAFVDLYRSITLRQEVDNSAYLGAFAALVGATILVGMAAGTLVSRGVASRLGLLAQATGRAGAGDLSVRVAENGSDELAELARAFNRMLHEIETNRSRIDYLQRIAAWQEMARRLAHEIKNPLTPIQLAIEELHKRYSGDDVRFRDLLNTSVDIVESEIATLRRLVSEFSGLARLPRAELVSADLFEFVREQEQQLSLHEGDLATLLMPNEQNAGRAPVEIHFEIPAGTAPACIDEQMLRRVLMNLIRNAVEAINESTSISQRGQVIVNATAGPSTHTLSISDNGPGIAAELRSRLFEPYVTTKRDGTGLGLAIVKKIVVEHGGEIVILQSKLGGAEFKISLPRAEPDTRAAA